MGEGLRQNVSTFCLQAEQKQATRNIRYVGGVVHARYELSFVAYRCRLPFIHLHNQDIALIRPRDFTDFLAASKLEVAI